MLRKYLTVAVCFAGFVGVAVAGDFVPFVIPAVQNEDSVIAMESQPIRGEADRVVVRSGHFHKGRKRIRLWGVNLSFAANLPTHSDAERIARRMAAAGVNTVRLHHLDTSWYPRGWWKSKDGKGIEPEAFDRLDYFIDQFAKNGIYVNLNLHVGREHSRYIGLPKSNRGYDKISNIFTPALVDAQKDFAREVLGHINKYRDVTYANDPAIAIVEITNENSFFMWSSEDTLRTLPPYYAKILWGKYNEWLKGEYGTTSKLEDSWGKDAQPLGDNFLLNNDFSVISQGSKTPKNWNLEQHSGSKAELSVGRYQNQDAIELNPTQLNGTDWHLQFGQSGLALKEGRYYTVSFKAVAQKDRSINCNVSMSHEPWSNLGLSRKLELADQWKTFRFGFVAKAGDDNARITFVFGGDKAKVYLSGLKFQPGGLEGVGVGESLERASVGLYSDSETPQRMRDRMRFLADTEKAYFDDMKSYIQNEMGSKSLVTGTIVFGPLGMYAQSDMDFIDAHAYWQHPRFPNRPWDSGDWLIDQKPMTDYFDEATLFRLAGERMAGKPFTVTEYNHPAPLDSQAECVPMIASWAAAHDWDGVWLYTYSHSGDQWDRKVLSSYFDIDTNPSKWGFMRAAAEIFGQGKIAPLPSGKIVALGKSSDIVSDLAELHLRHDTNMFGVIAEKGGLDREDLLKVQIASRLSRRTRQLRASAPGTQIKWSVDDREGFYFAKGARAWVLTGHPDKIDAATTGTIEIVAPDFVAVTMTALDGAELSRSKELLITACGRCENNGMKFSADRRTLGREWGTAPVMIETVDARIRLRTGAWKCWALDPEGVPSETVPVRNAGGHGVLEISGKYKTMWYLLKR